MGASPIGARNPQIQRLRRLSRRRSSRLDEGRYVIDGPVLVAEAIRAGVALEAAYVDAEADAEPAVRAAVEQVRAAGVPLQRTGPGVLAGAVDTVTPHGMAAVAVRTSAPDRSVTVPLVVVLAGLGDPGNAGTLLRSAEAAGASAVWATAGTVDLYAPKTVRSSAGSLFHVPVRDGLGADTAVADLRAAGVRVLGTVARGGTPVDHADLRAPVAFVLGNEAHGLDPVWAGAVDEWLTIPMVGRAESLNVAMAGTLLCFEAARQRRGGE